MYRLQKMNRRHILSILVVLITPLFIFRPVQLQYLYVVNSYVKITVDMLSKSEATHLEMKAIFDAAIEALQIGTYQLGQSVTSEDT